MCRLLGWVATAPRTLLELLGRDGVAEFTELSRDHADGWGFAWWSGSQLEVVKSTMAAHADPDFSALVENLRVDAGMLHFRWATPGLAVRPENTHPFCHDGAAFAHNGRILPFDGLLDLLAPGDRDVLQGNTDSERYFRILTDRVRSEGTIEGVRRSIAEIGAELTPSSLNALLLTARSLTAVSCYDAGSAPTLGGPATVLLEDEELPHQVRGHFELRYRVTPDEVVVASSGWSQPGWQLLPNGTVLQVPHGRPHPVVDPVGVLPAAARRRAVEARIGAASGAAPSR